MNKLHAVNPLFFHLLSAINDPEIFLIILMGGRGSGKSYSVAQALSLLMPSRGIDILAFREVGKDIPSTVGKQIINSSRKLQKYEYPDIILPRTVPKVPPVYVTHNNNYIKMDGSDGNNDDRLKGLEKIGIVYLDEVDRFSYEFVEQVEMSLRGMVNQKLIVSFNPVSVHSWVKSKLVDRYNYRELPNYVKSKNKEVEILSELSEYSFSKRSTCKNVAFIKTTYRDNFWVSGHPVGAEFGFRDQNYINRIEKLKITNPNNYKVYSLGEWGNPSEGLVCKYVDNFDNIGELDEKERSKILWSTYEKLPDIHFYETFGLDFGGAGNEASDKPDGHSKTVFGKVWVSKDLMEVYVKVLLYKGYISPVDLVTECKKHTFEYDNDGKVKKRRILADNARQDKIRDLMNEKIYVIGAKTREGGSKQVVDGYDILKKYKIFIHVDDTHVQVDLNSHKYEVRKSDKEQTGNVIDKHKDFLDMLRYAVVNYDLYNN